MELIVIAVIGILVAMVIFRGIVDSNEDNIKKHQIENERNVAAYVNEVMKRVKSITLIHIKTLLIKQSQTVTQDAYGNFMFDKWFQEIDYFIKNVLVKDELIRRYIPNFPRSNIDVAHIQRLGDISQIVINTLHEHEKRLLNNNLDLTVDADSLSAIEFEHYCAKTLRNCGWDARVTQSSGDQGIDIIANRGDIKVVFQCKKYSQPVGNAAVQEIVAGKHFEQADIAVVVSNNSYTQSAKQLASVTGVHFLHYSELEQFAEKVGIV